MKNFEKITQEEVKKLTPNQVWLANQWIEEKEKVSPHTFHIHSDSHTATPQDFIKHWKDLGGFEANFLHEHDPNRVHFEPFEHATIKTSEKKIFAELWESVCKKAGTTGFKGYLEGEYIPMDELLNFKPFLSLPKPFLVKRRKLTLEEGFRESELHLTFHDEISDSRAIDMLYEMGMYGTLSPKHDGVYRVLTIQGSRKQIREVIPPLKKYVLESGGLWRATLKIEDIIRYQIFNAEPKDLPEVVDTIEYF
ncbi:hypothetical protein H6776_00570 [Candidatus Nomurabacteria bacterium]|nr:hypothetical protein [Candidatus Nomurabacteria bacterium]